MLYSGCLVDITGFGYFEHCGEKKVMYPTETTVVSVFFAMYRQTSSTESGQVQQDMTIKSFIRVNQELQTETFLLIYLFLCIQTTHNLGIKLDSVNINSYAKMGIILY